MGETSPRHRIRRGTTVTSTLTLALALGLAAALAVSCNKKMGPDVGKAAPDFVLPDLGGARHGLGELKGRVVVLNFWATWCPPCIDEMPSLERLHQVAGDKGVEVLAVSVDERFSDIEDFVKKYRLSLTVLHDEGKKVSRRYQTFKYPETYILDRDGILKSKVVGPRDWSAPSVIRDLVELAKQEPAQAPVETTGEARPTPKPSED
jgi:peroxiredoxin